MERKYCSLKRFTKTLYSYSLFYILLIIIPRENFIRKFHQFSCKQKHNNNHKFNDDFDVITLILLWKSSFNLIQDDKRFINSEYLYFYVSKLPKNENNVKLLCWCLQVEEYVVVFHLNKSITHDIKINSRRQTLTTFKYTIFFHF